MPKIYFDHSATTPVDKKVLAKMLPYFSEIYGNATSIHGFGQEALEGVDRAREAAANLLNCEAGEIIFTSGATESDNLAIKGYARHLEKSGRKLSDCHFITSTVEHDAVLEPFLELKKGGAQISYAQVLPNAVVDLKKLKVLIQDNTVLISVMWANSEVGSVMPIREIGKIIKKVNDNREKDWKNARPNERGERPLPIVFHVDATQAINFLNCDVRWNYIDLLSMSGHKIYGPKGVGLLYKRKEVRLDALQRGGHQENNLRSGTLNVSGIVGLGEAIKLLGPRGENGEISSIQRKNNEYIAKLRDRLVAGIVKKVPDIVLNTDREIATPAHAHFSFMGVEGEALLMALDMEGIAVSTGSACASGSLKGSHVLAAMGIDVETGHYSIRFTLGKGNTKEEIDAVVKLLPGLVERYRKMNPLYKK